MKKLAVLTIDRLDLLLAVVALSLAGMASYWSPFARHVAGDGWWSAP